MNFHIKTTGLAAMLAAATTIFTPMPTTVAAQPSTITSPTSAALSEATVKSLQEALSKQGIAVKADGILSDETRAAIRAYQSQHHLPVTGEPDKATLDKLGVVVTAGAPASQGAQSPTTSGPGSMMRPHMMQSMAQGKMAPGMMNGQTPMSGAMPMQPGMMMCPMMTGMMGQQPGMMGDMGRPARGAAGLGVVMPSRNVSVEDVREHFERYIQAEGNPRVKLGAVNDLDSGSIVAEIVTVDGSVADRFSVNRRSGIIQRAQ
ncbi:MAG: peptidoglycan-binding domain-containing protein [Beijerinckiaceae bacterium]|nr:peptidoglycan-binding domain-containing protein [Beijerinckiaceae bacterium]